MSQIYSVIFYSEDEEMHQKFKELEAEINETSEQEYGLRIVENTSNLKELMDQVGSQIKKMRTGKDNQTEEEKKKFEEAQKKQNEEIKKMQEEGQQIDVDS